MSSYIRVIFIFVFTLMVAAISFLPPQHHRTDSSSRFTQLSTAPSIQCSRPVDIIYIVDESGSIDPTQFEQLRKFMNEILQVFVIEPINGVALGVIGFSAATRIIVELGSLQNTTACTNAINNIKQKTGGTNTGLALDEATEMFARSGRAACAGASRLAILLTDGASNDERLTIAAAERALAAGITIAVVTINFNPAVSSPEELAAEIGGDENLWFEVEDWSSLDTDTYIVAGLSTAACNAPIAPNAYCNVTAPLTCNNTLFFRYEPQTSSPMGLVASISILADLCYSYFVRQPLPSNAVSTPGLPTNVTCVRVVPAPPLPDGTTPNITLTTYPSVSAPGSSADPLLDLFVSVTAVNGTNSSCSGTANISTRYCSRQWVANPAPARGRAADAPVPTITQLGSADSPRCGGCPPGAVKLGGLYPDVCSPRCLGGAQYIAPDTAAGDNTCIDCDISCGACTPSSAAPDAPPQRACTACSAASAGWLAGAYDPAQTSPFTVITSALLPPSVQPAAVTALATTGRCLVGGCPTGFTITPPLTPATAAVPAAVPCQATPAVMAAAWSSVLVTLCVPRAAGVPAPAPGQNSTLDECRDFINDARAPALALQISRVLGVPLSALYLRSCLDVRLSRRFVWTYESQTRDEAVAFDEPDAPFAVANATRRAGSNCSCDVFATYAIALGVATPGSLVTPDDRAAALTMISSDSIEQAARAGLALSLISTSVLNTTGLPLDPLAPLAAASLPFASAMTIPSLRQRFYRLPVGGDNGPSGGYVPLRCDAVKALLLDACLDSVPAASAVGIDYIRSTNVISFCYGKPPPEIFPSGAAFPVAVAAVVASGAFVFLSLLLLLLCLWSRAVARRRAIIAEQKARVARAAKRRALGGDAASKDSDEEVVIGGDKVALATESRAAFKPIVLDDRGRDSHTSETEVYVGGSRAGAADWGEAKRFQAAAAAAAASEERRRKDAAPTIIANPLSALDAARAGAGDNAQALASARSKAVALKLASRDEDWQAVPLSTLTRMQRVREWIMPGSMTLGMGLNGAAVPVSHDLAHPQGPKAPAAYLAHKDVAVTMGRANNIPSAWAAPRSAPSWKEGETISNQSSFKASKEPAI